MKGNHKISGYILWDVGSVCYKRGLDSRIQSTRHLARPEACKSPLAAMLIFTS